MCPFEYCTTGTSCMFLKHLEVHKLTFVFVMYMYFIMIFRSYWYFMNRPVSPLMLCVYYSMCQRCQRRLVMPGVQTYWPVIPRTNKPCPSLIR